MDKSRSSLLGRWAAKYEARRLEKMILEIENELRLKEGKINNTKLDEGLDELRDLYNLLNIYKKII